MLVVVENWFMAVNCWWWKVVNHGWQGCKTVFAYRATSGEWWFMIVVVIKGETVVSWLVVTIVSSTTTIVVKGEQPPLFTTYLTIVSWLVVTMVSLAKELAQALQRLHSGNYWSTLLHDVFNWLTYVCYKGLHTGNYGWFNQHFFDFGTLS